MKIATVKFKSVSPIAFGRFHNTPKIQKESDDAYEKRTWKERLHADKQGNVIITPFMVKNMLSDTAKYLSIQIPGKGKSTYTKHFEAGLIVQDYMPIGIKKSDVEGVWMHVPSDGTRGGKRRVPKCFPVIQEWSGQIDIYILDDTITKDVLMEHLQEGGKFIGMGSFRPRNNGIFGRFDVDLIDFKE